MKHLGIRAKLTLSYAATIALVLVVIGGVLFHLMTLRLDHAVNERLKELSTGLWGHMEFRNGEPTLSNEPEDYFVRIAARWSQLYDAENGRLLAESEESRLLHATLSPGEAKRTTAKPTFDELASEGVQFRFYSTVYRAEQHPYLLRVGVPLVQVRAARQELIRTLLLIFPPSVLLAGLAGRWMAGNALKPVEELRIAAHQIGISRLDRRLPLRGTRDELDGLAKTFNQVFARLEEAVGNMKQFTASISHELRTPLAALQGEAEVVLMRPQTPEEYRRVLTSQLEEFHKLNRLTNRLLELAMAEAGEIQLENRTFDIAALLHSMCEQMEPIAASQHVSLEARWTEPIQLVGDPHWLERAILNLLDNAIKFTPEGGKVCAEATSQGNFVQVEISDTGTGIPQEALPHIYERFYRVDDSRSRQGVGLGLAIVKWIIEAHHGTIQVKSEVGAGSHFTILLPLTSKAHAATAD